MVTDEPFLATPFVVRLTRTPWNDRVLGGPTANCSISGYQTYVADADLGRRQPWLARRLATAGLVYVATSVPADDHLGKALVQHLGFDFVYQTTTCVLNLTPEIAAFQAHSEFKVVSPQSVPASAVATLCASTMRAGRLHEDWLTREAAASRTHSFITELHSRPGVHRIFTVSSAGQLNGYAYIPIEGASAELLMMGLDEKHAPVGGGELFWRTCLAELARGKLARRVHTRVPAANLGVLNIYARIGFSFIRPAYDFRLFPTKVAS